MKTCTACRAEKPLAEFFCRRDRDGHYAKCKSCMKVLRAAWRKRNPHKNAEYAARKDHERMREIYREMKRRQRQDPRRRFVMALRSRVAIALNGARKHAPTFRALGYTREQLMAHLERQFISGMSWANYGQWHVDHILPLSSFSFTSTECDDFKQAWALTNLRPLWALDNIKKKDRRTHLL